MKIEILGAASSKFGELWSISPRRLVVETVNESLSQAKLDINEIEAIYVGNMLSGILANQENLGAFFAEEFGLSVPSFKVEGACASGGLAVHNAVLGILSGMYRRVLVIGVEKMTDHPPEEVATALMGAGSEGERISGITFPGLYALLAKAYMEKYNITEKGLAAVAVKNHYHGSLNPKAHFRFPVTIEKVLMSPSVATPLKLLDCSPISDGASVVILGRWEANKKRSRSVYVTASTAATDSLRITNRKSLTSLSAAVTAARRAYKTAGILPSEVDVAEVHDCFTIAEIIALEDLDFFPKGKAAKAVANGEVTLGYSKKLVVNTSGGLKACGHPVGATGVKQIVEIFEQLKGISNGRQVKNARVGLTHNVGGSGAVAVIHILKV